MISFIVVARILLTTTTMMMTTLSMMIGMDEIRLEVCSAWTIVSVVSMRDYAKNKITQHTVAKKNTIQIAL